MCYGVIYGNYRFISLFIPGRGIIYRPRGRWSVEIESIADEMKILCARTGPYPRISWPRGTVQ